jgi:uncharacterized protein YciW
MAPYAARFVPINGYQEQHQIKRPNSQTAQAPRLAYIAQQGKHLHQRAPEIDRAKLVSDAPTAQCIVPHFQ